MLRILFIIAVAWLVRFLWNTLAGKTSRTHSSPPSGRGPSTGSKVITGQMKKDPQCGTYVSTELSLKSSYHNEVLHFCSRQCQEKFLEARTGKSA